MQLHFEPHGYVYIFQVRFYFSECRISRKCIQSSSDVSCHTLLRLETETTAWLTTTRAYICLGTTVPMHAPDLSIVLRKVVYEFMYALGTGST